MGMSGAPVSSNGQQRRSNEEIVKDFNFFRDNYDALLSQYSNQWIAVLGERVVGAAANYFEMRAQLGQKGIAYNETIREYMTREVQEDYVISDIRDPKTGEWQMVITHYRMRNGA